MMNIQPNLDRFNHELTLLQQALSSWHEELAAKETQVLKENVNIKRQREELIQKSNLIVEQVNGLRSQKEEVAQKMLEAEKLRKASVEQLETVENLKAEVSLRENDLTEREKNFKLLEKREQKLIQQEEIYQIYKKERELLRKEQELLDEKQQVLIAREKKVAVGEDKQKRIMGDL